MVQLAARDEQRHNFALNSVAPQHQEVSVPGVPSDIGGGYPGRMTEKLLISRPRSTLVTPAQPLERSRAWRETQEAIALLEQRGLPGEGEINPAKWFYTLPGRANENSQTQRAMVAAAINRNVRGELSRVYLKLMRELAVQHQVPFDPIDESDNRVNIPADLQPIAESIITQGLNGSVQVSQAEYRYLHARYIHLSANWVPVTGLLLNKPAKNHRAVYVNKPQKGYPE